MIERIKTWHRPGASGTLYSGDALEFLKSLSPESADLIFLDPPFNLGKNYSSEQPKLDSRPPQEYSKWLSAIAAAAVRVLARGGALFLYHLPKWALRIGAELEAELVLRHWIAIAMKNGFARGERLYPAHYALLYFTKGLPAHFERPRLRPRRCRHCDELVKDYGGYTNIIEQKGVNLSDVWDDLSPIRHPANKYRDANELPSGITDRVVQISGHRGGMFVDPFAGAGAALVSAVRREMRFRACDLLPENCQVVVDRIDSLKAATRKTNRKEVRRAPSRG